jgi:hypothetical protein
MHGRLRSLKAETRTGRRMMDMDEEHKRRVAIEQERIDLAAQRDPMNQAAMQVRIGEALVRWADAIRASQAPSKEP